MPLTRRQFELGIDEEAEGWMRQLYQFLSDHRDLAYSSDELRRIVQGNSTELDEKEKFEHVLYLLTEIGGLDVRVVRDLQYFTFLEELDTTSWKKAVFRL